MPILRLLRIGGATWFLRDTFPPGAASAGRH